VLNGSEAHHIANDAASYHSANPKTNSVGYDPNGFITIPQAGQAPSFVDVSDPQPADQLRQPTLGICPTPYLSPRAVGCADAVKRINRERWRVHVPHPYQPANLGFCFGANQRKKLDQRLAITHPA